MTQVHTMLVLVRSGIGIALVPASAATLRPEGVVFRSIGAFCERPVELDVVWRGDSTNPALRVDAHPRPSDRDAPVGPRRGGDGQADTVDPPRDGPPRPGHRSPRQLNS